MQARVVVCAGSEGIRDTCGPYGNADMLERAMFVGQRYNLRRDDELALVLDVVTIGGARAPGLEGYGLAPGCGGDLALVEAETIVEAVAQRPGRRNVVKRGRVVAHEGIAEGPHDRPAHEECVGGVVGHFDKLQCILRSQAPQPT